MLIIQQLSKIVAQTVFISLFSILTTSTANAASVYFAPTPYKSFADSPLQGKKYSYFYLEDFEDAALNTPGVTAFTGKVLQPIPNNTLTDSVDGDDQLIDGNGLAGYSWYSQGNSTLKFTFNLDVLGALPTDVGIVWTDVGFSKSGLGYGQVNLEAFDAFGASLGRFESTAVGDGNFSGQTDEDRFFGLFYQNGISAIEISLPDSTDWEVDHLQYGRVRTQSVPEPGTLWLILGVGVASVGLRSPHRHKLTHKI